MKRVPLVALLFSLSQAGAEELGGASTGIALVEKYECARCHNGLPGRSFPTEKHCVACHQEILGGTFRAPPETLKKWQHNLHSLLVAPSLQGSLLDRAWITAFLLKPHDVRPDLAATMPRLPLTKEEAATIAQLLVPNIPPTVQLKAGDPERGRALYKKLRCGSCHRFTGTSVDAPISFVGAAPSAIALAPDLRHARQRIANSIGGWLLDPQARKPHTLMPKLVVAEQDATDLTLFLLTEKTAAAAPHPPLMRLPVLKRRVAWDEVNDRVFRRTCWHCHSSPDYALGDGGPGNTGGFGFAPRGLDLATATGAASGALDESGKRQSIFRPTRDGTPRLLQALLARHLEERGGLDPELRGMPLGLPALSAEQIQLVESWIAQGRPR